MPVLTPTGVQFLIADLVPEVIIRVENRTQDTNRAAVWLRDALLEISGSPDYRDDFPELEEFGPIVQLTPLQQEYDNLMFIPVGDTPSVCADILIWVDFPANVVRRKLDVSHYQKTDRFTPVFSLPTEWYTFGPNTGFNPVPDKPYQVQARMVRMHPINDNVLSQTLILLPRDWNEVLIWLAVMRGFAELMEFEKQAKVYQLLHGDPKDPSQPGLFYSVKRKRRKEQWRMESRLSFTRRASMWGAG
jgi:hypothetical protein